MTAPWLSLLLPMNLNDFAALKRYVTDAFFVFVLFCFSFSPSKQEAFRCSPYLRLFVWLYLPFDRHELHSCKSMKIGSGCVGGDIFSFLCANDKRKLSNYSFTCGWNSKHHAYIFCVHAYLYLYKTMRVCLVVFVTYPAARAANGSKRLVRGGTIFCLVKP